jgi:hypothetical protein
VKPLCLFYVLRLNVTLRGAHWTKKCKLLFILGLQEFFFSLDILNLILLCKIQCRLCCILSLFYVIGCIFRNLITEDWLENSYENYAENGGRVFKCIISCGRFVEGWGGGGDLLKTPHAVVRQRELGYDLVGSELEVVRCSNLVYTVMTDHRSWLPAMFVFRNTNIVAHFHHLVVKGRHSHPVVQNSF